MAQGSALGAQERPRGCGRAGGAASRQQSGTCVPKAEVTRSRKLERLFEDLNKGEQVVRREREQSVAGNAETEGRADNKSVPLNTVKKSHGGRKSKSKEGIMLHFKIYSARALSHNIPISVRASV